MTGRDRDPRRAADALHLGGLDAVGADLQADIAFIATPVGAIVAESTAALDNTPVVTDVGSVKGSIVNSIPHRRFVGGHPMAGTERASLFSGAVWALTPRECTDRDAVRVVKRIVRSIGAEVLELTPEQHDAAVSLVSHVPHLLAAGLVGVTAGAPERDQAVGALASGSFRI